METKDYAAVAFEINWAITHQLVDESDYNKGRTILTLMKPCFCKPVELSS